MTKTAITDKADYSAIHNGQKLEVWRDRERYAIVHTILINGQYVGEVQDSLKVAIGLAKSLARPLDNLFD